MVCAFQGWNDAGDAASGAVSFLASALDARRFARIDSEEFYDFQANRPCIRFTEHDRSEIEGAGAEGGVSAAAGGDTAAEGGGREIVWPTVEIFEAPAPRAPRDLVLVQGVEPSMRWRAFSTHLIDLAEALGVQVVVSLGALLGDVPHTRPVTMTGHASDAGLLERLGIQTSSYEGPTGIVGVLHTACAQAGLPSASLWASVPHYVAAAANPKAALALLRKVEVLVGVSVDVSELESSAADYERQVRMAVRSDPDIQAFVERLEQAADSEEQSVPPEELPSGDILASEFQRFLRQRGREGK
jgi:predicted ATP-grasp superfamily ATP-dependent carboligase